MMDKMTEEVKSYKCNWCGKLYAHESDADKCAFNHAKKNLANSLLKEGNDLAYIEHICKFGWKLTEEQKEITKDNCFIMSHWQCSDKPAYRIVEIDSIGSVRLWGKGGWSGYYGHFIGFKDLPKAHEKEELYKYVGLGE